MYKYKDIKYYIEDETKRPFRAYFNSRWHFYKKYEAMTKAIDEYLKAKERY